MKKSIWVLLLSSVLMFGTVNSFAKHHKGGESEKHEMEADANKDGKVSFEEFKAARVKRMEEHFNRRDANGDGFIDAEERKAAKERHKTHNNEKKQESK